MTATARKFSASALTLAVIALAMTMLVAGCRRTDIRDFEIKVPELTRENAMQVIRPLAAYQGLEENSIAIDPDARVVKLKYDSMKVAKKNLEMAIALAGYEANGITPESVGAKRASAPKPAPKPDEAK